MTTPKLNLNSVFGRAFEKVHHDNLVTEIESRLVEHLNDFAGGDITRYEDEGINGHGMTLRIVCGDRFIEVDASIKDVTEDLNGEAS